MEEGAALGNISSDNSTNKWIWMLIGGIVFVVLIFGIAGYLIFGKLSNSKISEKELYDGYTAGLSEDKKISFEMLNETHSIIVNSVKNDSVEITIASNPIRVNLTVGQERKFDINNDGIYDLFVKLNSLDKGKPNLTIRRMNESVPQGLNQAANNPSNQNCVENWNCGSWSACSNNLQTRTCVDNKNCGTTNNRPLVSQTCTNSGGTCLTQGGHICSRSSSCSSGLFSTTDTDRCCMNPCTICGDSHYSKPDGSPGVVCPSGMVCNGSAGSAGDGVFCCSDFCHIPELNPHGNCYSRYLYSDTDGIVFRCENNNPQQKWIAENCSMMWKDIDICNSYEECYASSGVSATCQLKTCSEVNGLICEENQECQNNNVIATANEPNCCLSSCINKTCTESEMKAITDNEMVTDPRWAGNFTNINYKKIEEHSQWQLYYCATKISEGNKYQLIINFHKTGSWACREAGDMYILDSLNGNIC